MKPFAYHLYHTPTEQHYYGVRYKKGCYPEELWTSYFSSSSVVHSLIERYGKDSFIPTIRKVFSTASDAVVWESRFLARVDAQHNQKWLNRHNGSNNFMGPHFHNEKTKAKIGTKLKGIKRSVETKNKMRASAIKREAERRAKGWRPPADTQVRAVATRRARIAAGEINPYSEDRNIKMRASKKGTRRHYLPDGSFIMVKPQADQ
jgi:hypothetical protein